MPLSTAVIRTTGRSRWAGESAKSMVRGWLVKSYDALAWSAPKNRRAMSPAWSSEAANVRVAPDAISRARASRDSCASASYRRTAPPLAATSSQAALRIEDLPKWRQPPRRRRPELVSASTTAETSGSRPVSAPSTSPYQNGFCNAICVTLFAFAQCVDFILLNRNDLHLHDNCGGDM